VFSALTHAGWVKYIRGRVTMSLHDYCSAYLLCFLISQGTEEADDGCWLTEQQVNGVLTEQQMNGT
jgi:hypothetical protein